MFQHLERGGGWGGGGRPVLHRLAGADCSDHPAGQAHHLSGEGGLGSAGRHAGGSNTGRAFSQDQRRFHGKGLEYNCSDQETVQVSLVVIGGYYLVVAGLPLLCVCLAWYSVCLACAPLHSAAGPAPPGSAPPC